MIITLEGIEGTGKSTLAKQLSKDMGFILTKEPGSTISPLNTQIREIVLHNSEINAVTRELMFLADASNHRDLLEESEFDYIADRGLWSHLAYQYGLLKTRQITDYEIYLHLKRIAANVSIVPDAIIYLEGDIELMNQRLEGRKKDHIESQAAEYFAYVLAQYDDLVAERRRLGEPLLVLNARDDFERNLATAKAFIRELAE